MSLQVHTLLMDKSEIHHRVRLLYCTFSGLQGFEIDIRRHQCSSLRNRVSLTFIPCLNHPDSFWTEILVIRRKPNLPVEGRGHSSI